MLSVNGLSKKYITRNGYVFALNDISFSVKSGEFVAIMGQSGSGKSTLLNIIGGLERADFGSITFNNTELCDISNSDFTRLRRNEIGIIYQFFNLIPELSVWDNVIFPLELDGVDFNKSKINTLLSMVGMSERKNAFPATLSGGEQQRTAIARALAIDPSIILADEPTGNLDSKTSHEVLALLKSANKEKGVTIIMVTHSKEMADYADRVIFIENGRIIK